jgi:glycolate oxidase iron-sulfur subunit
MNISNSGADYLVTSNPGCLLQLKKGLAEADPPVQVIHLTELLRMSMEA